MSLQRCQHSAVCTFDATRNRICGNASGRIKCRSPVDSAPGTVGRHLDCGEIIFDRKRAANNRVRKRGRCVVEGFESLFHDRVARHFNVANGSDAAAFDLAAHNTRRPGSDPAVVGEFFPNGFDRRTKFQIAGDLTPGV